MTFDLSRHVFGHILWPDPWGIRHLTTINGCLAVVSWESEGDSGTWVMKEYSKTESLRFKLPTRWQWEAIAIFQPIRNGDIVAYSAGGKDSDHLTVYSESTHSDVEVESYVESLELVDKESATPFWGDRITRSNEVILGYSSDRIMGVTRFEF